MLSRRPKSRSSFRVTPLIGWLIGVSSVCLFLSFLYLFNSDSGHVHLEPVPIPSAIPPSANFPGPPQPIDPPPVDEPVDNPSKHQSNDPSNKQLAKQVSKDQPFTEFEYKKHIPIVIFTFNRPENLRLTLESLFSVLPRDGFAVYVSQDGDDVSVRNVIESFGNKLSRLSFHYTATPMEGYALSYQKIAAHYGFALGKIFDGLPESRHFDRVIMLEDDMKLSPDFFSYFRSLAPLFDRDPSLYCVSAWNDNGQPKFISDPRQLYRTECFPGLGWMMSRALWEELGRENWTWGYWDDWLREPPQRKGRSCIYPEINRVSTFGAIGTSGGQFYEQYLRHIKENTEDVCWNLEQVDLLKEDKYDEIMANIVRQAVGQPSISAATQTIDAELSKGKHVADVREQRAEYSTLEQLSSMIGSIGLITDHKAGVPRTSYKGVMQFRHAGVRVWLVKNDAPLLNDHKKDKRKS